MYVDPLDSTRCPGEIKIKDLYARKLDLRIERQAGFSLLSKTFHEFFTTSTLLNSLGLCKRITGPDTGFIPGGGDFLKSSRGCHFYTARNARAILLGL